MIKLPPETSQTWEQNNRSDTLGTLWSSFNLNLTDQLGKTKVTQRLIITTNGITNLGCPVAFKQLGTKIYTVAGSRTFINPGTKTETAFVEDVNTLTSCSSDYSDLEIYNSKIWTTSGQGLYWSSGGSWTLIDTGGGTSGLTSGTAHKLLSFFHTNLIYVADGNRVRGTDGSAATLPTSGANTYTFGSSLSGLNVVSLLAVDDLIWILTTNPVDQTGYVVTWDGTTADTPTKIIPLDSRGALAGIVKDGTVYIITIDGKLQFYNGQTFVNVKNGWLPVSFRKYLKNPFGTNNTSNDRWIHPNGITLVNGKINILVNNENYDNGTTINENLPSGIWEYDETIGWYHKNSISLFDTAVGTVSDYGQNRVSRVGALCNLRTDNNSADSYVGTLLVGANYFSGSGSTAVSAIYTNDSLDTVQKHGYLVTTKIPAKNAQDSWQKLFIRIKQLLNSTDEIIAKYRVGDATSTEISLTWNYATSFTTSTDLSNYVGYEVEGLQGAGSGRTAHITKVEAMASQFIVTIDETLGASSGTGKARIQNWSKLDSTSDQVMNLIQFGDMGNSTWLQIKLCMLYTGNDELYNLIVDNGVFQ